MKLITKLKNLFRQDLPVKPRNNMRLLLSFSDGEQLALEVRSPQHAQRTLNRYNWSHIRAAELISGSFINFKADENGILRVYAQ